MLNFGSLLILHINGVPVRLQLETASVITIISIIMFESKSVHQLYSKLKTKLFMLQANHWRNQNLITSQFVCDTSSFYGTTKSLVFALKHK